MSQTIEGICNLALDKLGADPIVSLSAPTKPNERLYARQYPHWRDAELRRHRWRFSIETVRLTPVGSPTVYGNDAPLYRYAWPNNALRAIRTTGSEWKPSGGKILLDASSTYIDVDFVLQRLPSEMDELFIEVLACRLAFETCEKITQSNEKKRDLMQMYKDALAEAKLANAYEAGTEAWIERDTDEQYTWEQARVL